MGDTALPFEEGVKRCDAPHARIVTCPKGVLKFIKHLTSTTPPIETQFFLAVIENGNVLAHIVLRDNRPKYGS